MRRSGKSFPSQVAYRYFGFELEVMAPKMKDLVEEVKREGIEVLRGDFLNRSLGVGLEHYAVLLHHPYEYDPTLLVPFDVIECRDDIVLAPICFHTTTPTVSSSFSSS